LGDRRDIQPAKNLRTAIFKGCFLEDLWEIPPNLEGSPENYARLTKNEAGVLNDKKLSIEMAWVHI